MAVDQDVAGVPRGAGGRALPPAVLASLREAFAGEVADRLPRLLSVHPASSADDLAQALRDAHSLGSSAVVLGEPEASRVARSVEAALAAGDVDAVPAQVERLADVLASW